MDYFLPIYRNKGLAQHCFTSPVYPHYYLHVPLVNKGFSQELAVIMQICQVGDVMWKI